MKDVGMRIRVEPDLRDAFVRACREEEIPAAQVIRSFMRSYLTGTLEQGAARKRESAPTLAKPNHKDGTHKQ
ncbi:MAG: hypothetical protein EOP22_19825 [Hyphomicrobiales bacterium]|nr:MAG: hypothetical protein EOP22_19825 [Hyphomicrobiales bacterium]